MAALVAILGQLAALNVKRTVARTGRNGIFLGIAGILFLTTYLFALIALALWIARRHDPIFAALVIAAGTLVIGLIVLVVMAIINRIEERRMRERRAALDSAIAVGFALIRKQPMLTAAIAAGLLTTSIFKTGRHNEK